MKWEKKTICKPIQRFWDLIADVAVSTIGISNQRCDEYSAVKKIPIECREYFEGIVSSMKQFNVEMKNTEIQTYIYQTTNKQWKIERTRYE